MIVRSHLVLKELHPGAKCQWCGDTGKFEDDEGCVWDCFDDCPRDKEDAPKQ